MDLKPVVSRNISAIGYENGALCVRFKQSGTEWIFPDVPAEKVGLLMTAKSIGGYFASDIKPHYPGHLSRHSPEYIEKLKPKKQALNTAEADDCCKPLRADLSGESWTCPKCGCVWKPEINGPIRHWRPVAHFQVFQLPGI